MTPMRAQSIGAVLLIGLDNPPSTWFEVHFNEEPV
jgi:hypothetical protein